MREVYMEEKQYSLPSPIVNKKESDSLDHLTEEYKKLLEPSKAAKAVKKAGKLVPAKVKKAGAALGTKITQQELYQQAMEIISSGFKVVETSCRGVAVSEHLSNAIVGFTGAAEGF